MMPDWQPKGIETGAYVPGDRLEIRGHEQELDIRYTLTTPTVTDPESLEKVHVCMEALIDAMASVGIRECEFHEAGNAVTVSNSELAK